MRKGFTLLELLIVIIIIGILAVFALQQFFQTADTAKQAKARQVLGEIRSSQVLCRGLTGGYIAAFPVTCTIPGGGTAVTLPNPSDAYWTYTIAGATSVATRTAACGAGCAGPFTIDYATGVIS